MRSVAYFQSKEEQMNILRVLLFLALLPPENDLELSRILPIALAGVLQVDLPDYIEKKEKKYKKTSYPPPLKAIIRSSLQGEVYTQVGMVLNFFK